jgi:integrase/recombinase XerD
VAGLTLEDIDWKVGRLRLRSKCKRFDELPLPADVGEAIEANSEEKPVAL